MKLNIKGERDKQLRYAQYLLWCSCRDLRAHRVEFTRLQLVLSGQIFCRKLNRADSPADKDTQAVEVPND
jgi:hypothetical protein